MKIKSCYLTTSQVHLVTKSDMLCLHSEHTEIFAEGIFFVVVNLHYKEISVSFDREPSLKSEGAFCCHC